jgi:transposase-like protein
VEVRYKTVRRWVLKFRPAIARGLRRHRPSPSSRWHLDKIVIRIGGRQLNLWPAVDDEGEVLGVLVQRRQNRAAAHKPVRRRPKKRGFAPST